MTPSTTSSVEPAALDDAEALHRLRRRTEDWLADRGIEQWGHGHLRLEEITRQIRAGQWQVLREPGPGIVVAARLLGADPAVWGEDDTPAVYVHGLMVHRAAAGRGLGALMLEWAAERGRAGGVTVLRLDCVESNTELRAFYRRQGFREVGRRDFEGPWYSATLLEKPLAPNPQAPG